MKKFLSYLGQYLINFCIGFTAITIIFMIISAIFSDGTLSSEIIAENIVTMAVITFIQMIAFSGLVFKKMRYNNRLLLFSVIALSILTVEAILFKWFPTNMIGSWILFVAIFLVILFSISFGFSLYFKAKGKKYDELLAIAQNKNK